VLKQWQGLGYNRRAKYLHEAAKILATKGWQEKLPGVGPYTRAAVEAFAYNKQSVFIETNIRTVFTHFYFKDREGVADSELLPLIERDFKKSKMEPRDFYAALMDYGSYLKRSGVQINKQNKHYVKQKKFEGSERQLRGIILRELLIQPHTVAEISKKLPHTKEKAAQLLAQLVAEGLLKKKGSRFGVAD
jgi:A/G-specific adenine glycosylase